MATLHLPVKSQYFYEMKDCTKLYEYRLRTDRWAKRLVGREYTEIQVKRGYPKADDFENILFRPYRGYEEQVITHPHFGPEPVEVFAIIVN